ncbi:hypothetical protein FRC09_019235 [Ceratobasidium sp. 395]|nr:hypothetical protein FRC09_019235 [Ceratobasidium sp. 395]
MNSNSRLPTIRTEDITPESVTPREQQSLVTPAVPPSSPSIPRLPSQNFDSPSLDISISSLLASTSVFEPKPDKKIDELTKEKSQLDQRLREIEQRLKAVEEAEKKRGAGTTA